MIARRWRGRVRAADSDAYLRYVEETGVRELRETPGNEGVLIFRTLNPGADASETAEIEVVSLWRSLDDVRAFAGQDVTVARFFPDDDRYLVNRDLACRHDQVDLYLAGRD